MSLIKIKSFLDHKRGLSYWDGADRNAMNLEQGRFAVADGVSHSFLPNLWAGILCESFVNSKVWAEADWIRLYADNQLTFDCQRWSKMVEATMQNATEDEAFLLQLSRDEFHYAGSTLVGIAIKERSVHYNVLGDSCLFVFDKEAETLVPISTINEGEGFTNRPDYFLSSGKVVGNWKHGQMPLKEGYVFLMTDALSDWLIKEYAQNPAVLDQLWNLNTHDEFMRLVEEARDADVMKDDDVALMMLKIESGEEGGYELLCCDTLESLMAQEQKESNDDATKVATDLYTPKENETSSFEEVGAKKGSHVVEPVFRYRYVCPICGHRYYQETARYCGMCGFPRGGVCK